jgi:uncharacterized protein YerC
MNKGKKIKKEERIGNATIHKLALLVPQRSVFESQNAWEQACWINISKSSDFLQMFVTPGGKRELVMRASALSGIHSGKSYREISRKFFVSLQTICAVKKVLEGNGYRSYSDIRKKKEIERRNIAHTFIRKEKTYKRMVRTKYGKIYVSF